MRTTVEYVFMSNVLVTDYSLGQSQPLIPRKNESLTVDGRHFWVMSVDTLITTTKHQEESDRREVIVQLGVA